MHFQIIPLPYWSVLDSAHRFCVLVQPPAIDKHLINSYRNRPLLRRVPQPATQASTQVLPSLVLNVWQLGPLSLPVPDGIPPSSLSLNFAPHLPFHPNLRPPPPPLRMGHSGWRHIDPFGHPHYVILADIHRHMAAPVMTIRAGPECQWYNQLVSYDVYVSCLQVSFYDANVVIQIASGVAKCRLLAPVQPLLQPMPPLPVPLLWTITAF